MTIAQFFANTVNKLISPYGVRISRTTVRGTGLEEAARIAINQSKSKNPLVLDIGANNGGFSSKLLNEHPHVCIHAFEPNPIFHPALECLSQKHPRFTVHRCALGSSIKAAELNVASAVDASSLLRFTDDYRSKYASQSESRNTVPIEIQTLDNVLCNYKLEEQICLLKMDVQGFEGEVLRGARQTLRRTEYLVTEAFVYPTYAGGIMIDELCVLLSNTGFKMIWGFDVFPATLDLFWQKQASNA